MSKTIKQIADELGVSKTAVCKKMTPEVQTKFAVKVSGVVFVDEQGESLIKQGFLKGEPQTEVSGVSGVVSANQFPVVSSEVSGILEVLQGQLAAKDLQISEKDKQLERQQQTIGELTAALEHTTQSLQAAQALHAGTMQQQKESLPPITGEPVCEQQDIGCLKSKQKNGFWNKILRK